MARQERPLDPAVGPVQSFAHELRQLRAQAGNPTYRAMARTAGYSASTLSEAASGTRKPTLDVVRAYVGACHGDRDAWERRWHELDADAGADTDEGARTGPPAPAATRRDRGTVPGRLLWPVVLAAALLSGTAVAIIPQVLQPSQRAGFTMPPDCPAISTISTFTGKTYGDGARVRRGATRDEPVIMRFPAGCVLGFIGYCIGEVMLDATAGTPDVRWFKLDGGGVVASAVIHGNPPPDMPPSRCERDRPPPSEIKFDATPSSRGLSLRASGRNLAVVGFAVAHRTDPEPSGSGLVWRQVSLTDAAAASAGASWQPAKSGRSSASNDWPVLATAAACLGGNGPTDVVDVRTVHLDDRTGPASLDEYELRRAASAACQYP